MKHDHEFWEKLDKLVEKSEIVIDRPKGSKHPRYSDFFYPFNYGYLKDSSSLDGDGIDVCLGSGNSKKINGVLCIVDLIKKDSEIKILIDCDEKEINDVYEFLNSKENMKAVLFRKN